MTATTTATTVVLTGLEGRELILRQPPVFPLQSSELESKTDHVRRAAHVEIRKYQLGSHGDCCLLLVSLCCWGSGLPLVWTVVRAGGNTVEMREHNRGKLIR